MGVAMRLFGSFIGKSEVTFAGRLVAKDVRIESTFEGTKVAIQGTHRANKVAIQNTYEATRVGI